KIRILLNTFAYTLGRLFTYCNIKLVKEGLILSGDCSVIFINTISGGIVNFGGANKIAPVSISKTTTGSRSSTSGQTSSGSNIPSNLAAALEGGIIPS
ncbi:MAG: hypothetical protein Q8929_20930, partial [Bacillota bacterium]|nr:hypothetical protein [Bacillota bacterium]